MESPPGRGRNIWTDAQVETNGLGVPILLCLWLLGTSALPSVAPDSPHLLSQMSWVPLLSPLPPQDGLIPVTSTEAPVMYPLSSDAKNATTSATSMGIVGRGQAPTYSHRPKRAIISHQKLFPPKHSTSY